MGKVRLGNHEKGLSATGDSIRLGFRILKAFYFFLYFFGL